MWLKLHLTTRLVWLFSFVCEVNSYIYKQIIFHRPLFLTDSNPDIVEDAVKYIIFLVDADRLFDTALGMYDFSLVLMIAQHAQKVCMKLDLSFFHLWNEKNFGTELINVYLGPTGIPSFPARVACAGQVLPAFQN